MRPQVEEQESFQDIDDGKDNDKDSSNDDDNNGDDDNKNNNNDDDDDGGGGDWSFICFLIMAMVMLLHDVIPLDINIIAVLLLRHTTTRGLSS